MTVINSMKMIVIVRQFSRGSNRPSHLNFHDTCRLSSFASPARRSAEPYLRIGWQSINVDPTRDHGRDRVVAPGITA